MTMTAIEAQEISKTIFNQLGGNKFIAMTGAKNFRTDEKGSLIFTLPHRKFNYVQVTLNGLDLYDMEFKIVRYTLKSSVNKLIERCENLYSDMLCEVFTEVTGLDTSL